MKLLKPKLKYKIKIEKTRDKIGCIRLQSNHNNHPINPNKRVTENQEIIAVNFSPVLSLFFTVVRKFDNTSSMAPKGAGKNRSSNIANIRLINSIFVVLLN
ncbi:MAG: hypothetical protein CBD16_04360 [Betaproteobacteria bacterium TMED156]|nr:MAG: hypothetical protein CBD16_04360 [Betaproteobacteria bacterium TMED156]